MKRESAAERALNRQIKLLRQKHDNLCHSRDAITNQIAIVTEVIRQIEEEVDRSKDLRLKSSEAKKP